jgi:hypothetical protein
MIGLYINLDPSHDRRAHMESEFRRFGLSDVYRRVAAVADTNPAQGCYRSHLKALQEAKRLGGNVHILEDDSILSPVLKPFLESAELDEFLSQFDLLFLDMWIDGETAAVRKYQMALRHPGPMNLRGTRIGATSSYIVAANSISKVHKLVRWHQGRGKPIDALYGQLVDDGTLTAAVTLPFLTGVDIRLGTQSLIQTISPDEQRRVVMLRTAFFADKNRQPAMALPSL